MEDQAAVVPTGMPCSIAGDAPQLVPVGTHCCAMVEGASTADILGCQALNCYVSPVVEFQAVKGLTLSLFSVYFLMAE